MDTSHIAIPNWIAETIVYNLMYPGTHHHDRLIVTCNLPEHTLVRACSTIHLCWNVLVLVSRMFKNISLKKTCLCQKIHTNATLSSSTWLHTSICILRWILKVASRVRNIDKDNSNTAGTALTPFFDRATHRYCLMALMNTFSVQNIVLAFCNIINNNSNESILERSSCDLDNKKVLI